MDKLIVKAIGQTVEMGESASLVLKGSIPPDCMVLFVSLQVWKQIKDSVEIQNEG